MNIELDARLKLKTDTEINWENNNPIILDGEIIVVKNSSTADQRIKIGNGVDRYLDLPFLNDLELNNHNNDTEAHSIMGWISSTESVDSDLPPISITNADTFGGNFPDYFAKAADIVIDDAVFADEVGVILNGG